MHRSPLFFLQHPLNIISPTEFPSPFQVFCFVCYTGCNEGHVIGNGCEATQWSVSKLTGDREFLKMFVQRVLAVPVY